MSKIIQSKPTPEAQRIEREDDRPAIGSWWWLRGSGDDHERYDEPGLRWIGCVIEIGSNYAELQGVRFHQRIALDEFHEKCSPEANPEAYIASKVSQHKDRVRELTGEIARICALLGVPMRDALVASSEESSQALAVAHGTADIKAYETALVKAKDRELPELFKEIKNEHEHMAKWMKADLIPLTAQLDSMRTLTKAIDNKIQMVELYGGLVEKLVCVLDGKPAPNDTKVTLMQRRHYMDEECLIRYEAGGMSFEDIEAFDRWLARREHMTRIFPHERCIVAFKIRRWAREYDGDGSLASFIAFRFEGACNKQTFLYIRNGDQLWRLQTAIDFGSQLFPNKEDHELLNNTELWIYPDRLEREWSGEPAIITRQRYNGMLQQWHEERHELARQLWAWKRAGKPTGEPTRDAEGNRIKNEDLFWTYIDTNGKPSKIRGRPGDWRYSLSSRHSINDDPTRHYQRLTPENIYFDDAMRKIRESANDHNRVAVVIQGLLDRSTCLHPHPPWKLFTAEGFARGIELVYDDSRAITSGEPINWNTYRAQLNKSIRPGAYVMGQYTAWCEELGIDRSSRDNWRIYEKHGHGPKGIQRVLDLRGGKAKFTWGRRRLRAKKIGWIPSKDRPGWGQHKYDESDIPVTWWCSIDKLFCVDGYTPGDFHLFYDDPRTRADYIEWAPYLLAAEDWHHKRRTATDETNTDEEPGDE